MAETNYFLAHARELGKQYAGQCVAIVDNKVVAVGANRLQVYREAAKKTPKHKAIGVFYVPLKEEVLTALWNSRINFPCASTIEG